MTIIPTITKAPFSPSSVESTVTATILTQSELSAARPVFGSPVNLTTTTVTVLGRPSQDPYNTLAASIVSISEQTTTFALECRPSYLLKGNLKTYSSCTEHKATITAGPSMFAYVDADTSVGCSHASNAETYTCRVHNPGDQVVSNAFFINEHGLGGQAELLVTAGLEKLNGTSNIKSDGNTVIVSNRLPCVRWCIVAILISAMLH